MIPYSQYLVLIGAIALLIGTISYIKETLKGNTKPNRVSWLIWSIAPMIATIAAISDGITWPVLPVFMSGFCPLLVFIASFINKNSYWKLRKIDYFCGLFSILALIFWGITKEPNVAIVLTIISDGLATIPTLIKLWKYPETETIHAYTAAILNALTSFFAINIWNFSSYAFPIYLLSINILFVFCFYRNKIIKITFLT